MLYVIPGNGHMGSRFPPAGAEQQKKEMQGMLPVWIYTGVESSVTRNLTHRNKKNTFASCNHGPHLFQGIATHTVGSNQFPCLSS